MLGCPSLGRNGIEIAGSDCRRGMDGLRCDVGFSRSPLPVCVCVMAAFVFALVAWMQRAHREWQLSHSNAWKLARGSRKGGLARRKMDASWGLLVMRVTRWGRDDRKEDSARLELKVEVLRRAR